jgi:large subunit ribosomal protein L6
MKTKKKIYSIKIPNNITVIYYEKKNILVVIGPLSQKSLELKPQITLVTTKKLLIIKSVETYLKISNSKKKYLSSLQGTTTALIKQLILETSYIFYKKLKLIGVGYRAFDVENFKNKLLLFKLGYSHSIYFKCSLKSKIFCLKNTKLFIFGNSYQNITQYASFIRSYKKPEPYKGKGILYDNEKITLKEGKKI